LLIGLLNNKIIMIRNIYIIDNDFDERNYYT
jgi:hypothetical protein